MARPVLSRLCCPFWPARYSRRRFGGAGLALSYAALGGVVGGCRTAPAKGATPLVYAALGASDAAGVGIEDMAQDNWVAVLGRRLPQPTRVVNLGIPGIRLEEAIAVELPPALDAGPQLITVWLVVNDILAGVSLERYRASLDRLLSAIRAGTGARVAVGNVPNAPQQSTYLGIPAAARAALTASWNDAIAQVTQAQGAILVDLYTRWPVVEHPEYIGPDGLHPTVAGYRTLAETFLQVLREQHVV